MTLAQRAHVLVVANAKGGSGKSTTAIHVVSRLLRKGLRVGVVDIDVRQKTLTRYLENRAHFAASRGVELPMPDASVLEDDPAARDDAPSATGHAMLCEALQARVANNDVVVIDAPGSDNYLARLAIGFADTLFTPLNDSFIDLDVLAHLRPNTLQLTRPSTFSEMIWSLRKRRFLHDGHRIDWVVARNRLSHTDARNKRHMREALAYLAPRLGFRQAPGLGDRVIFRELFRCGLTLSDLHEKRLGVPLTMTHVAAHQEIKDLVEALNMKGPLAAPALLPLEAEPVVVAAQTYSSTVSARL